MFEGEDIVYDGVLSRDSLTEYHRRKRAEAELAALEKVQEIEGERSMRRWVTANAIAQTIADHPVATVGVGLAGVCLIGILYRGRR
jgi:hypothetical protein